MSLQTYRDLAVWQKAIDMVEAVYVLAKSFPDVERFGLTCQLQRAAVSVSANIAEGYGRTHRGDYLRSLSFAKGSLAEVETHLIIAGRLRYVTREQARPAWEFAQEVGRMLHKLIAALQDSPRPGSSPPDCPKP